MKVLPRGEFISVDIPYKCPMCNTMTLYVSGIDEWDTETGEPLHISIDCKNEPDMDSKDWWEWFRWHSGMPYVDWLPLHIEALKWFQKNYRIGV